MLKKRPSISFVVPLYNKQAYIADCLESLKYQTFKDIEIIVVDDKSTDDSLEIADYMATQDDRITVYRVPFNTGRSSARNTGNVLAKSKIIAVQDADDISFPTRASEIVKAFNNKIDVFYSGFQIDGQTMIEAKPIDIERTKTTLFNYIGHSTMAYRKAIVPLYSTGEWSKLGLDDWKIQIDMMASGLKFHHVNKPLVYYRRVVDSISHTRDEKKVKELKQEYLKGVCL